MKELKIYTPLKIVLSLIEKYNQYALDESKSWLAETGWICCNGKKYCISKRDILVARYGEENVRDMERNR
jgi:hypothetical protein